MPASVQQKTICSISGLLAVSGNGPGITEYFATDTLPTESCPGHVKEEPEEETEEEDDNTETDPGTTPTTPTDPGGGGTEPPTTPTDPGGGGGDAGGGGEAPIQ